MTLSTPSRISFSRDYNPVDPDALAYLAAVEAADEAASPGIGPLEQGVRNAVNEFVLGCKADGIWPALKASCILAGARTLDGCLVPLVGTAPTKQGTEGGWSYNRKTGLQSNGTDNYLNSNRNNIADPQNSKHVSIYASSLPTSANLQFPRMISSGDSASADTFIHRLNNNGDLIGNVNASGFNQLSPASGFIACSRSLAASYLMRRSSTNTSFAKSSSTPRDNNIGIFASVDGEQIANARLAFYSIGESLDLALLDARVTALIAAIGAAIS